MVLLFYIKNKNFQEQGDKFQLRIHGKNIASPDKSALIFFPLLLKINEFVIDNHKAKYEKEYQVFQKNYHKD